MGNFQQHFTSETVKKLETLKSDLQNAAAFSDAERRELFRTLHTVKGSSQTFGFDAASRLAHELENLLTTEREGFFADVKSKSLLVEGIDFLVESLREKNSATPQSFIEKIRAAAPQAAQPLNASDSFLSEIPFGISSQLSNWEKTALLSSLSDGRTLYAIEIGFDSVDFAGKFKEFREILSDLGEIIATLPSLKFNQPGKIGFQVVFTSFLPAAQLCKTADENCAEVILDASETEFPNDLAGILAQAVKHGKTIAAKLGKQVEFTISADAPELSAEKLKLIFDVLVHLTRNAVDHAIESEGKIEIALKAEERGLRLSVSDDGRGIDLEKVKAKAVEKNLICADQSLTEPEMLELIFLPEFSTASKLTEISGRGVGLDAVKDAVEKAGGKINVKSRGGRGAKFEIFLPKDE